MPELNEEIDHILAGAGVPAGVAEQITTAMEKIDRERVAPGLEVGETAPDFELPDEKGRLVALRGKLADGPVVVSFFRGAWCPICNLQIAAFARATPEVRAAGASIIAIHSDQAAFDQELPEVGFDILSDVDHSVTAAYRLEFTLPLEIRRYYSGTLSLDLSQRNHDGTWKLPVPGTFILDQQGVVRARHVTADFTRRMEPEDVLEALEELSPA